VVSDAVERRLAAILSADAAGYSRMMASDEDAAVRAIAARREEVSRLVGEHRGRVVDAPGDNLLAEFASATEAVSCALAVQRAIAERNAELPPERRMQLRIGVHLGEVRAEGGRIYGDGVNVAARLEGLAEPGGVCISDAVLREVRNKLPLDCEDLGARPVKNIPEPVRAWRVRTAGAAPRTPRRTRTARVSLLAAALAVALAAGGLWLWRSQGPLLGDPGRIESLAVLPLENLSGDPEQEFFADGMTDALIADLARVGALRVISRTSIVGYKGTRKPLPEIARELGVDAVVEGTVVRAGDRVRITAQLIDARTDAHLWAERYDRDLRDVLSLQSEVARAVASAVHGTLGAGDAERLTPRRRVDPRAHEAYLRGRVLWREFTPEAMRASIEHLERAVEIDPDYALAHASLAFPHCWLLTPMAAGRAREEMPKARAAAERALALDATLGEAHAALALVQYMYDWDWPVAERSFERALELSPSEPWAYAWYAFFLASMGRFDEALELGERGLALGPLDPSLRVGFTYQLLFAGEVERALSVAKTSAALHPDLAFAHRALSSTYFAGGRIADGVREQLESRRLEGILEPIRDSLRRAFDEGGWEAYARARADAAAESARRRHISGFVLAGSLAAAGQLDAAFAELERAFDERDPLLVYAHIVSWPEKLFSDPRFGSLIRRIGLPEVERRWTSPIGRRP
jgi:adenylate cyclase